MSNFTSQSSELSTLLASGAKGDLYLRASVKLYKLDGKRCGVSTNCRTKSPIGIGVPKKDDAFIHGFILEEELILSSVA